MDVWNTTKTIEQKVAEYSHIQTSLANKINPETGELLIYADPALVYGYNLQLQNIVDELKGQEEQVALIVKNLDAEEREVSQSIREQQNRKKAVVQKRDDAKGLLNTLLNGQPFKTGKVVCSYRTTSSVDVSDHFVNWAMQNGQDDLLTYSEPKPNKNKIRDYLKAGGTCPEAEIVSKKSLSIK